MLRKKVKSRILFLLFLLLLGSVLIFFVLKSLESNIVYFFSPTEINTNNEISNNKIIRVGGLVKKNSIKKAQDITSFIITDLKYEIVVSYVGIVPNLFAEGKGVIAEGVLKDRKYFLASKILAKHDENYMPPEVGKLLNE